MRVDPTSRTDVADVLGDAPEEEYTFLLVPVGVFSVISQRARQDGCSTGEIVQRALLKYLETPDKTEQAKPSRPAPSIILKRKR